MCWSRNSFNTVSAKNAGSPQVMCTNDLWLFHYQRSAFGVGFGADTNRSFPISLHMPVAGQRSARSDKTQADSIRSVMSGAFRWTLKAPNGEALTYSLGAGGSFFLMRQLSILTCFLGVRNHWDSRYSQQMEQFIYAPSLPISPERLEVSIYPHANLTVCLKTFHILRNKRLNISLFSF